MLQRTQYYLWKQFRWLGIGPAALKRAEWVLSLSSDPTSIPDLITSLADSQPVALWKEHPEVLALFEDVPVPKYNLQALTLGPLWVPRALIPSAHFDLVGACAAYALYRLGKEHASPALRGLLDTSIPEANARWGSMDSKARCHVFVNPVHRQEAWEGMVEREIRALKSDFGFMAGIRAKISASGPGDYSENEQEQLMIRRQAIIRLEKKLDADPKWTQQRISYLAACDEQALPLVLALTVLAKLDDPMAATYASQLGENGLAMPLQARGGHCIFYYLLPLSMVAAWVLKDHSVQGQPAPYH